MPQDLPDPPSAAADRGLARARKGRALAVGVALLEALVAAGAGVVALVTGLQGGSLVLGLGVGAACAGLAYLLLEVARGFAAWRAWPTGIFLTVQVLVVLVALSVGSRAVLSLVSNPRVGGLTLLAVLVGVAGVAGAVLMAGRTRRGSSPPVL
ncbi:hypothetical protein [Aquipuribacter sp. MA13-6]|uniref:hypothetical protein n=1 Tax=unclassified Aquipuribacter TaxID=2635084 RepID=UPI003EEFB394